MWAPWRMEYVQSPKKDSGNIFSKKLESEKDEDNMILYRGKHSFVCINLYPYNNGHLLVIPNEIVDKQLMYDWLFEKF